MPIWPFRKRRRGDIKDDAKEPLTEKVQPTRPPAYTPAAPTQPIPIPRSSSKRDSQRERRISQDEKAVEASLGETEKRPNSSGKENVPPSMQRRRSSREDITALPMSKRLESSPHLRPVDMERPAIPYNFRQHSDSQTSIQRDQSIASPQRPRTLRSRRSGYDSGPPSRHQSGKSRRRDDHLREEEIRAMSAQMPIPKRPGGFSDGPLRRDSKKMRGLGMKGSNVSLPAEESVHSNMSAILEQRGWEIGGMDVFSPRPAVRLSGTPQYVSGSLPVSSPLAASPEPAKRDKEKMPASRDSARKRETIGNRADDFDASDIRMLLERDDKRREKRRKEQQEKLDKKLRSRGGRNRGDSDKRRREAREAEEVRRAEEAKERAEEERRARELMTPPIAIHPALRDAPESTPQPQSVGLGIGEHQAGPGASESDEKYETAADSPGEHLEDPFTDEAAERESSPVPDQLPQMPGAFEPVQTPMEDPVIETAREVRLSQAATPPLSPVQGNRATASLSQVIDSRRASDVPTQTPAYAEPRRPSEPKSERRAGTWATFFRRGGTTTRKPEEIASPPSQKSSFSNISRESARNQPLPAHLVDTQVHTRRKSGPPVRTQSKFREDLPEMPISPPDSRMASPEVTAAAAVAAARRRAGRSNALDDSKDTTMGDPETPIGVRSDTPISPPHRIASMGSVDSEGSWFASGTKRHSSQSALGQRRPDFSASYEELGGDNDAEYVNRAHGRKISSPTLSGPDLDEESEEDEQAAGGLPEAPEDPFTVHDSVRRTPTLIHRGSRVKSREGLLAEYAADDDEPEPTSAGTGKDSLDLDTLADEPESVMQRATSIDYKKGHSRQVSAGSAKLLDIARRSSADTRMSPPPTPQASSSRL